MTFFTGDPFGMNEATQKMIRDMQTAEAEALEQYKIGNELVSMLNMSRVDVGLPSGVPIPFEMDETFQKQQREDMERMRKATTSHMPRVDIGLPAGVPTPFEIDEAFQKPIRDIQAAEARLRDQRNAEFRAAEKELRESERMQDILTRLDSMRRPDKLADLEARIEWLEQNSRRRLP
jgi:hypothetical protein